MRIINELMTGMTEAASALISMRSDFNFVKSRIILKTRIRRSTLIAGSPAIPCA